MPTNSVNPFEKQIDSRIVELINQSYSQPDGTSLYFLSL